MLVGPVGPHDPGLEWSLDGSDRLTLMGPDSCRPLPDV